MSVYLDFPGLRIDKKQPGAFRCHPYTGGGLLEYSLNLLAARYVSKLLKFFLRNGVAVHTVRRRTDIDLVAMPVQGGCNRFVHCRTEYVVDKTGCRDVEHRQTLQGADE